MTCTKCGASVIKRNAGTRYISIFIPAVCRFPLEILSDLIHLLSPFPELSPACSVSQQHDLKQRTGGTAHVG